MRVAPPPNTPPGSAPARRPTDDGVDARIGLGAMSFGAGGAAGLTSDAGLVSPSGLSAAAFRLPFGVLAADLGVVVVFRLPPTDAGVGVANLLGASPPTISARSSPSVNAPIDARPDPPPNKPAALDPGRLCVDILLVSRGFSPPGVSAAAARIPAGLSAGASSPGLAPPPAGDARVAPSPPGRFAPSLPRRASAASAAAASCMPALVRCSCMSCSSSPWGYCTRVAAAMACRSRRRSGAVAASLAAAAVLPLAAPPAVSAMSSTAAAWNSAPASTAVEAADSRGFTSRTPGRARSKEVLAGSAASFAAAAAAAAEDVLCVSRIISVSRLATCRVCRVCAIAGSLAKERSTRQQSARAASALGAGRCFAPLRSIERIARIPPDSLRAARACRRRASTPAANLSASLRSGRRFLALASWVDE
mmetsp:Transcript_4275/g.17650  ORF Transcript_4275/g.17650 Transcript_4275/m.17650 type:complete len:421 (+) Transcript_4275:1671-2933(+)